MSATPGRARRSTIRVALGLAITGLVAIFSGGMVVLSAGPAVSVPGSSPADPIVVANPADVPVGAVEDVPSTYGTPSECDTTRSWVFVVPGTDAVTHQEWTAELRTRTKAADVEEVWANWQPNNSQGPQDYEPLPPTQNPDGTWNVDTDVRGTWIIHEQGIPGGHEGPDGVYQQGGGNSPWFFRRSFVEGAYSDWGPWEPYGDNPYLSDPTLPSDTDLAQYRTSGPVVVTDQEATPAVVTYYAWTDGRACEQPTTPTPTQPTTPQVVEPTTAPPEVAPTTATAAPAETDVEAVEEPAASPQSQSPEAAAPEVLGVQASEPPPAPPAAVPTVVDAGLAAVPGAGATTAQLWGVLLAAMGMVLLASAGGVLVRIRQA
jgi:hypothetical protein